MWIWNHCIRRASIRNCWPIMQISIISMYRTILNKIAVIKLDMIPSWQDALSSPCSTAFMKYKTIPSYLHVLTQKIRYFTLDFQVKHLWLGLSSAKKDNNSRKKWSSIHWTRKEKLKNSLPNSYRNLEL